MRQRHRAEVSSPSTNELGTQNTDPSKSEQTEKSHNSDSLFSLRRVFTFCLAFRIANALLVRTYFNPDEHWQALEVAHCIAFGYGHLTWEWKKGIRSYLHPFLFALLYKVLSFLGLDTPRFMIKAPRLLQSMFSAVGDLYLYKLSVLLFGDHVAKWAFIIFVICIVFALGVRVLVLGLTCILDRLMYGSWMLVPLNFLKFIFLSCVGDYYGTHKWHWYFSQGFTIMLFSFLPFSITGIVQSKQWKLSDLIAWVLAPYSVLGHKEFRFALPVLPVALMFSRFSLAAISVSNSPNGKGKGSSSVIGKWPPKMQLAVLFLLATNIPMAFHMSLFHQEKGFPCSL